MLSAAQLTEYTQSATDEILGQYQLLAKTVPHLAWTASPDGAVDFANSRWLTYTGLSLHDTLSWGWQKAIHPDDLPGLLYKWNEAITREADLEGKMRIRSVSGDFRWHLVRAVPIRQSNDSRILKWFGTNTDIHDYHDINGGVGTSTLAVSTGQNLQAVREPSAIFNQKESGLFAERYQLGEAIGAGGRGAVHKALHVHLDKVVAIKLINCRFNKDADLIRNFKDEARATSSINHPNVISILDFGITPDGEPFMVMDYVEGISLADYILASGRLDLKLFFEVFVQICDGLAAAHSKNIIHCDIKPANIMLSQQKETRGQNLCKLLDFGIARFFSPEDDLHLAIEQGREVVGSPQYMSPEQCTGERLDHRSDIYSLGCTMYQALAGRTLFVAPTVTSVLQKHVAEQPDRLRSLRPDIPQELDIIIMQMLKKDVQDRPASVQQIKQQLLILYRKLLQDF